MKVYIVVKTEEFNMLDNYYAYRTKKIAEKNWEQLGPDRFGYSIRELEFIEE